MTILVSTYCGTMPVTDMRLFHIVQRDTLLADFYTDTGI